MRKRLIKNEAGKYEWLPVDEVCVKAKSVNNIHGEDLSVNGYIDKYGGIQSSIDDSVHTTKSSYMEHIKRNNCVIKDF